MTKLLLVLGCSLATGLHLRNQIKNPEMDDAQLDELERQTELKLAETFEPSAELASAWKTAMKEGKNFAKVSVSVEEIPATCKAEVQKSLIKNPACADPWEKTAICQNAYEIPSYRLGDMFYESADPKGTYSYMKHYFPHSIAAKYMGVRSGKSDLSALLKVVDAPEYAGYEKPSPKSLVVHLRLGDVLYKQKPGYVRKLGFYETQAKRMAKEGLTDVVLVTGDHRILQKHALGMSGGGQWLDDATKQNNAHMAKVQKMFEKQGLKVTQRVNYNADCDVIYISNAHAFVESGGGYSKLMAGLVKLKGGQVWV